MIAASQGKPGPIVIHETYRIRGLAVTMFVCFNLISLLLYVVEPYPLLPLSLAVKAWLLVNGFLLLLSMWDLFCEPSQTAIDPSCRAVTVSWTNLLLARKCLSFSVDDSYFVASYLGGGDESSRYTNYVEVFSADLKHGCVLATFPRLHQRLWLEGPSEAAEGKRARKQIASLLGITDAGFFGLQESRLRGGLRPHREYGKPVGRGLATWDGVRPPDAVPDNTLKRNPVRGRTSI